MWTTENRPRYNRDKLRYPSDLTDAEWRHIEPLIPPARTEGSHKVIAAALTRRETSTARMFLR